VSLGAPSFEYFLQSDTQFANPLASAPSTVGSYVVIGFTPANSNYVQQGEAVYYSITPAKPTLALTANGGTYNGQAFAASVTVTGVSGTPAGSLESVAPTLLYYTGSTASGTGSSSAPVNAGTPNRSSWVERRGLSPFSIARSPW